MSVIYPIIKNPVFVDAKMSTIRMTLQNENGTTSIAEFVVPKNKELGVNKFWDRIVSEFNVKKMEQNFKNNVKKAQEIEKYKQDKRLAARENEILKILFAKKVEALKLPFVANGPEENKRLIRKSPDLFTLHFVLYKLSEEYMQKNSLSLLEFIEQIEESIL
jgi:hypothetical protein